MGAFAPDFIPVEFDGRRFRRARERAGFSYEAVATRAGVTARAVQLWEAGKRVPAGGPLMRACIALGIDIDDVAAVTELEVSR